MVTCIQGHSAIAS